MNTQIERMSPRRALRAAALALGAAVALSACSAPREHQGVYDPYEPINRRIFAFNDALDQNVVRPVAVAYRDTVPDPVRNRVTNVLRNMEQPVIFINEVLQGDFDGAEVAFARFFINSTIGLAGINDVAAMDKRLAYREEDFGQTLAVWGVDEGPYLMLPFLGPSNPRDFVGTVVDSAGDPITVATGYVGDVDYFGISRTGANVIDLRARTAEFTDELRESSIDYYATIRSLYRQNRQAQIRDGETTTEIDIPEYDFEEGARDDAPAAPADEEEAAPAETSELAPPAAPAAADVGDSESMAAPSGQADVDSAGGGANLAGPELVEVPRDASPFMEWARETGLLR